MLWLPVAVALLVAGVALVQLAYLPRWASTTRTPTTDEAERLASDCEAVGLDVECALVVPTGSAAAVDVRLVGRPGRRELLATEPVLEAFDEEGRRALLAAAAARAGSGIAIVRAVAAGITVGLLVAIYVTQLSFAAWLAANGLFGLAAFAVARRLHYAADVRAAEQVGADGLADAVEREATLRGETDHAWSWRTYVQVEPPLGARIERLRSLAAGRER